MHTKPFRHLKKLNNEKGVVFITVIMIIIVLMVLTVTTMSLNVGQTISTEGEYRRIQATELSKGAIAFHVAKQHSASPYGAPYSPPGSPFTIDNRSFTTIITEAVDPTAPSGTKSLTIQTTY